MTYCILIKVLNLIQAYFISSLAIIYSYNYLVGQKVTLCILVS
jgi:hypothetical protein